MSKPPLKVEQHKDLKVIWEKIQMCLNINHNKNANSKGNMKMAITPPLKMYLSLGDFPYILAMCC